MSAIMEPSGAAGAFSSQRIPSKFAQIGLSQLNNTWKTKNIPSSLLHRELGFPYYQQGDSRLESHVCRQIVSSRSSVNTRISSEPTSLVQDTDKRKPIADKWTRTNLSSLSNNARSSKCTFVDNKIMIEFATGGFTTGHSTKRMIMPNPYIGNTYHLEYELVFEGSKRKWHAFDVWYSGQPVPEINPAVPEVKRVPNTLFALEDRKLTLFDVNKGNRLDELNLKFPGDASTKYTGLSIDNDNNKIYIEASRSSLRKDVFHEVLILSYPPLSLMYRVQIPKAISKGYSYATNLDDLFCLFKSSSVEIVSLDEILRLNIEQNDPANLFRTVVVTKLTDLKVLADMKTKNRYLAVVPGIWPPHVCTKNKDFYEIYSLQKPDVLIATVPISVSGMDTVLRSYNAFDAGPTLLYSPLPHGLEILKVQALQLSNPVENAAESQKGMTVLFSTKQQAPSESTSTNETEQQLHRRSLGLRNVKRQFYGGLDDDKFFEFDYNPQMNLFAVCAISASAERLDVTLYDNFNMKVFKTLTPVKLKVSKFVQRTSIDPKMTVSFQNSYIAVKIILSPELASSQGDLYIINLLSEFL